MQIIQQKYMITSTETVQSLTYIEGNDQTSGPIWNYVTGTMISRKGR